MKKIINYFLNLYSRQKTNYYDLSSYSIQELKSMGFECKVFHSRFSNESFTLAQNQKHQSRRFNYLTDRTQCKPVNFSSRGGRTEIEIEIETTGCMYDKIPSFSKYKGIAYCSLEDNFNRKLGIKLALKKLIKV